MSRTDDALPMYSIIFLGRFCSALTPRGSYRSPPRRFFLQPRSLLSLLQLAAKRNLAAGNTSAAGTFRGTNPGTRGLVLSCKWTKKKGGNGSGIKRGGGGRGERNSEKTGLRRIVSHVFELFSRSPGPCFAGSGKNQVAFSLNSRRDDPLANLTR